METPTLIYDRECPYCTGIARLSAKITGMIIIPYQSEEAQEFLEGEFQEPGFTLYLIEDEKIFFGDMAAEEAAEKMKMPGPIVSLAVVSYPFLVKLFSVLSGRSGVSQPVCDKEKCVRRNKSGGVKERS
jgi:predicted DCC family thiol-disulfide oxidoreductase YuxK